MKNEIIQGGREIGKTTYLFQLAETSVNNGLNVIILDSATEHEDKSLLRKVKKRFPESTIVDFREESSIATYEELNKGLMIFEFPYLQIKNNQSNIICFDLSYFLERGHEVFDETHDQEQYDYYRNLYRRQSQQILQTLIALNKAGKLPNTIVLTDEIEFPIVEFDPTLFQEDLTIISSVHPENGFGTFYQSCVKHDFTPYKQGGNTHVLKSE
jgi:hypothetical protein